MDKTSAATRALLAVLLCGTAYIQPASAQDSFTVSGSVSAAEDNARSPIWYNGVPGDRYEVTVTDPSALEFRLNSTSFPSPIASLRFYDPSETDYADGVSAETNRVGFLGNVLGGPSIPVQAISSAGQYQAFIASSFGQEGDYSFTLFGATLGWGPSVAEEIATFAAAANATGRIVVENAHQISRLRGQDRLTTRKAALSAARVAGPETRGMSSNQPTKRDPSKIGEVYTWIDLSGFSAKDEDTGRSYAGQGFQIGADIALGTRTVAGLSLGSQDLSSAVDAVSQVGILRFVQPYLAYRSGGWSVDASLTCGQGDFDQTSGGGFGTGETRLAAISLSGGYAMRLGQGMNLTPLVGLTHGRERVEGVSGTLAVAGTETVRFTEVSLGAEIVQPIKGGEVFVGLHADWLESSSETALVSDLLVDDGATGRLELGLATEIAGGMLFDSSVEVSGLGGDLRETSGALMFTVRF